VGVSERRWRDIVRGTATPHASTAAQIARVVRERRAGPNG
jgi:hypothetical protein